jgi:hypothetical protein
MNNYKLGDVANGHILTKQGWVPVPLDKPKKTHRGLIVAGAIVALAVAVAPLSGGSEPAGAPAAAPVEAAERPAPTTTKEPSRKDDGVRAVCWTDCSAEDDYLTAYRARSEDFDTPDRALLDTSGQVCVAVRNRSNDEVREDLIDLRGLSPKQADGLLYASKHCRALGW